jgi:cysteine synthase A
MAMVCARLGLQFIAIMPEGVSRERILMIQGFGGEVCCTAKALGMNGANEACRKLAAERKVFLPRQFENVDNAEAHRVGTAAEIATDLHAHGSASRTVAFTSGIGTGGTMVGICQGLREHGFEVRPFAVRPVASGSNAMCGECFSSPEQCSFSSRIPGVLDGMSKIYRPDEIEHLCEVEIGDNLAMSTTRALIRAGFPVGPSSGMNVAAAIEVAKGMPEDVRVVTILCDRMERYFSTELFTAWSQTKSVPS